MAVKNGEPIAEWHGDTVAYGVGIPKDIAYGWCVQIYEDRLAEDAVEAVAEVKDEEGNVTTAAVEAVPAVDALYETWDCQMVEVTIVPGTEEEPQSESSTFGISDWFYVGTKQNFSFETAIAFANDTKNAGAVDSDQKAERNWQLSLSKTFTACYPNAEDDDFVDCDKPALNADDDTWMKSGINVHWFRDFETASDAGQDLQLDGDFTTDRSAETFAFFWGWNTAPATEDTAPDLEVLNPGSSFDMIVVKADAYDEIITKPAEAAAQAAADAAAAAAAAATEECEDEDAEDCDHDGHDHGDDGATAITAQATVLLAAIYTLAF